MSSSASSGTRAGRGSLAGGRAQRRTMTPPSAVRSSGGGRRGGGRRRAAFAEVAGAAAFAGGTGVLVVMGALWTSGTLARQVGQVGERPSQRTRHFLWNTWPQLGRRRALPAGAMQIAHSTEVSLVWSTSGIRSMAEAGIGRSGGRPPPPVVAALSSMKLLRSSEIARGSSRLFVYGTKLARVPRCVARRCTSRSHASCSGEASPSPAASMLAWRQLPLGICASICARSRLVAIETTRLCVASTARPLWRLAPASRKKLTLRC